MATPFKEPWLLSAVQEFLLEATDSTTEKLLKLPEGKHALQVTEIQSRPRRGNIYVTVSDTRHSILAQVHAVGKEPTKGVIISASEFSIRYNKKKKQLLLTIEKFYVESDGLLTVPSSASIMEQDSIVPLLDRLTSELPYSTSSGSSSPISCQSFDSQMSQPGTPQFATQLPVSPTRKGHLISENTTKNLLAALTKEQPQVRTDTKVVESSQIEEIPSAQIPIFSNQSVESGEQQVAATATVDKTHPIPDVSSEKENSREVPGESKAPISDDPTNKSKQTHYSVEEKKPKDTIGFSDVSNPFEGMSKIPRKWLRIPKDQQAILDGKDAWYDLLDNSRPPYALIPLELRNKLIARISNEKGSAQERTKNGEPEASNLSVTNASSQHEEEEDWSPSPETHKTDTLKSIAKVPQPNFQQGNTDQDEQGGAHPPHSGSDGNYDGVNSGYGFDDNLSTDQSTAQSPIDDEVPNPRSLTTTRSTRVDLDFPSSYGIEEELPLSSLRAEGEVVEDEVESEPEDEDIEEKNDKAAQSPETSQEMHSTALNRSRQVQVEKSPLDKKAQRKGNELASSSGSRIPATVNMELTKTDDYEVCKSSAPKSSVDIPAFQDETGGMLSDQEDFDSEDDQYASAEENANSPLARKLMRSSPPLPHSARIQSSSAVPITSRGSVYNTPSRHTVQQSSPSHHITNSNGVRKVSQVSPGCAEIQASDILSSPSLPSASRRAPTPKVNKASTTMTLSNQKLRLVAQIQQEESSIKDTKEMARALRHATLATIIPQTLPQSSAMVDHRSNASHVDHPLEDSEEDEVIVNETTLDQRLATVADIIPQTRPQEFGNSDREAEHFKLSNDVHVPRKPVSSQASTSRIVKNDSTITQDYYERFKAAYPQYCASRRTFTWAVVYVEWLREEKHSLLKSLIDSFIVIVSLDYLKHVEERQRAGKVPLKGWQFFDEMDPPAHEFSQRIIVPENLGSVLQSLDQKVVTECRKPFQSNLTPSQTLPPKASVGVGSQFASAVTPDLVAESDTRRKRKFESSGVIHENDHERMSWSPPAKRPSPPRQRKGDPEVFVTPATLKSHPQAQVPRTSSLPQSFKKSSPSLLAKAKSPYAPTTTTTNGTTKTSEWVDKIPSTYNQGKATPSSSIALPGNAHTKTLKRKSSGLSEDHTPGSTRKKAGIYDDIPKLLEMVKRIKREGGLSSRSSTPNARGVSSANLKATQEGPGEEEDPWSI
ncbi:hypothetical protein HYALB_00006797 [Hymenoscyphus albidus]|uniref:Telomere replication protein EST3 n=1 Tax=Hymenoscyphus albidus TaxID=595503 RepID=A0A9N9LHK4_9HELO|nr:hypothetical protein HYALB_00006797 [Hymenoscyphus albidus]